MKKEIVDFVKKACETFGFEAYYQPENDTYVILKKGRAIQNFNSKQFYSYPLVMRMKEYRGLMYGMTHNLGESYKDQILMPRKFGVRIV